MKTNELEEMKKEIRGVLTKVFGSSTEIEAGKHYELVQPLCDLFESHYTKGQSNMTPSKLQSEAVLELVKQFGETKLISRPDGTPEEKTFISKELEQFLSDQIQKAYSKDREEVEEKYFELIMAVENKYDGETRHQTALRYIKQGTTGSGGNACKSSLSIQSKEK